jgi:3'-phosphoadenosine 5'-phosphosulfate sulfotransferase (PAPS reductase)/FAD synthetase
MKNIIQVSGGKDSTATLLWAIEKGLTFEAVFCDTGWEAEETYEYLNNLEKALNIEIIRLYPKLGFVDLAKKKKRFPSTKARFCTTELKVVPFVDWLLAQSGEFKIYQGIRAEESNARAAMSIADDYFKLNKGDYAIRRIKQWLKDGNTATVYRPIFELNHLQVFELHSKHNIEPNPLYKQGFSRVGCMPCIMCRHSELKLIATDRPQDLQKIIDAEKEVGRTFFPPDYISTKHIATVQEVAEKLTNPNQTELFKIPKGQCKSIYNICE